MKRYKRTAQVVERLWLLLRLAHRWLHWRVYIGADGAIARLIICRSMRFHRRSPHSIFTSADSCSAANAACGLRDIIDQNQRHLSDGHSSPSTGAAVVMGA